MPAWASCTRQREATWAMVGSGGTRSWNVSGSPVSSAYSSACLRARSTSRDGAVWSLNHGDASLSIPRAMVP